ncbi:MAG: glycosyltransferase [Holosporales bacterium]|nr:glycosyltransferase [Holosporales bacterium]
MSDQRKSRHPSRRAPLSRKGSKSEERPYLSVVVPVFNEEECLEDFSARLMPVLEALQKSYEVIFVNDGSRDGTEGLLAQLFALHPHTLCLIHFSKNYGQYMAILAGFEHARGEVIVTLDADLQNPPEEIPNLLRYIDAGHDLVGSYRRERHDSWFRMVASRVFNWIRSLLTGIEMRDHGCMLRAYRRSIVDQAIAIKEPSTFINILVQRFALNPIDIAVEHSKRAHGSTKYDLGKLTRIVFDLVTGASLAPLRIFTFLGASTSFFSFLALLYQLLQALFCEQAPQNFFHAALFFFIGILIFGMGIVGEYVGRAYLSVCQYPRFVIRSVVGAKDVRVGEGKHGS